MSYRKYSAEDVRKYLLSHAEINAFYVTRFNKSGSGLINYFDSDGKNWCLMEDDDALVSDALEFLKENRVPIFYDVTAAQEFEAKWEK